ncbi:hypothetical protein DXG03_007035 [Asterophora parasitica]|uniref:Uncharacterized protein n=1 Tax=Asterophora parasitica TaxID=117018 RepID=A0A9P7KHR0_9AGAR|nr:hypothetical protein DXG03_007035 [Asterophora parasitica]
MPSVIRAIFLVTAFTALSQTAICALASPLPRSQTSYVPPAVISRRSPSRPLSRSMRIIRNPASLSAVSTSHLATPPNSHPGPIQNVSSGHSPKGDPYSQFVTYYKAASSNSKALKTLAAQSGSIKANDPEFQKKCVAQLNSFHANILGQQAALSQLDAEKRKPGGKGLDNYDRTNDIETLIKETVNLNKNTLSAVSVLVNNLPILGPILGPIVYDLKCFLDDILNFTENFLDATLNQLQPLLKGLLGGTPSALCHSGVLLLGLCI